MSLNAFDLQQRLCQAFSTRKLMLAYSGGLDSSVLLHLLSQLNNFQLRAIHVNHGLSKHANAWQAHCEAICLQYEIPLISKVVIVDVDSGDSLEAKARDKRYQAIYDNIQPGEVLLTAHHQNDQAETFLLQLFRGAGIDGLSSMPALVTRQGITHYRPLLEASRENIQAYADKHELVYIEDESNHNQRFARNYLRQSIIPQLTEYWPGVTRAITRSARHQADAKQLLDDFADQLLAKVCTQEKALTISALQQLPIEQQNLVLRRWLVNANKRIPSERQLQEIHKSVLMAAIDRVPEVLLDGVYLRRFRDELYLIDSQLPAKNKNTYYLSDYDNRVDIPGCLQTIDLSRLPESVQKHINQMGREHFYIRFRQGGERLWHQRKQCHVTLKQLFQDAAIPVWERAQIPLLFFKSDPIEMVAEIVYIFDARCYDASGNSLI